jgi:uncharacterized protein YggL (DUF469 family)
VCHGDDNSLGKTRILPARLTQGHGFLIFTRWPARTRSWRSPCHTLPPYHPRGRHERTAQKENVMSKRRSQRQRKKLHIGEFQELGFCFEAKLKEGTNDDALIDAFLEEAIAPQQLSFGGWVTSGTVEKMGRGSVSPEARQSVLAWLKSRPEIVALKASELMDIWYSTGKAVELTECTA